MSDEQAGPDGNEVGGGIGSLGEEATKLLIALSEWTRDHGGEAGHGVGGLASQAAAGLDGINGHIATGSAECTYCPVCRTVQAIRSTSPEARAHLTSAASSLLQAASGLLATGAPADPSARRRSVERIDLDDPDGTLR
ncbi:MAG: hypothetical protein WKF79_11200 [Nocardioides sp.]